MDLEAFLLCDVSYLQIKIIDRLSDKRKLTFFFVLKLDESLCKYLLAETQLSFVAWLLNEADYAKYNHQSHGNELKAQNSI